MGKALPLAGLLLADRNMQRSECKGRWGCKDLEEGDVTSAVEGDVVGAADI